jgi:hypothetical protein
MCVFFCIFIIEKMCHFLKKKNISSRRKVFDSPPPSVILRAESNKNYATRPTKLEARRAPLYMNRSVCVQRARVRVEETGDHDQSTVDEIERTCR